ncbi:MAG: putative multidrug transporter permease protein [Ilumatobacteraceae bacterium]|nr:putative multidrug transporter permease protein [Ilumatobacteraceae bacterium]
MRTSFWRTPLQTLTFMRKEITDAVHQPRLLITLVLGPFLIMGAFGLGYRETPKPLDAALVVPEASPLKSQIDTYTKHLGSYVHVVSVSSDAADASRRLQDGDVDVVVSFPADPMQDVLNGQQSQITIIHTRLDPIEQTAISFASSLGVDQMNSAVLAAIIGEGEQAAAPANDALAIADGATTKLQAAVKANDAAAIQAALADLDSSSAAIAAAARETSVLLTHIGTDPATSADASQLVARAGELAATVTQIHQQGDRVDAGTVDALATSVSSMRTQFQGLAAISPNVLAQPFVPKVQLAVPGVHRITDWYAPAAIVLILQQFGLAFGALTFVRERQLGITDVLRVAPVNAGPALIGKYLAYLLLGGAVGATLTALVVKLLDVPIAGDLGSVALVMSLTLFASIGLGFVLSLLCRTDGQAVQYALLVLLASLFFSGFFLSLGQLRGAAQVIGWLLPVTYGMQMLRDVMLRGAAPNPSLVLGLAGFGVAMFVLALLGTRRRMSATET